MFKHQYHQTKQDKTSEASSNKIPGQKKPLKFKRSFKAFQPGRARVPEYIQELCRLSTPFDFHLLPEMHEF